MSRHRGSLVGDDAPARLAGRLAELGITVLTLTRIGGARTLTARETDLPGELASGACELRGAGARFVVRAGAIEWECDDDATAAALASA